MDADYLVAGGGPAGLGVAIEAARRGRRVVLFERQRGPVDKACGEGLMPPGVARLRAMGVEPTVSHPFVGIRYVAGDRSAEARFSDGPGLGVRRTVLAEALRRRALALGVEVRDGEEVTAWSATPENVTVSSAGGTWTARWLVAADGASSRIRREAGIPAVQRPLRRFGMRRHFQVRPWSEHVEVWWAEGVEAYVTPTGPEQVGVAFLWSGEKGDYTNFLDRFPRLRERLGEPETSIRGAGPLAVEVSVRTAGRVLLAGDAAGYLDALTGEGLSLAWAGAAALVDAAEAEDPQAYERAWWRITRRHRWFTAGLLALASRPWARRRIVPTLAAWPWLFRTALALNAG